MSGFRAEQGGSVERKKLLNFTFDGIHYSGFAGDTLASALLANGVEVVARSPYLQRPRGIVTAGPEEPSALVQVQLAGGSEPLLPAPAVELFDGLQANSLAGRGRLLTQRDPARYDRAHLHCDVLVCGGGPAGLAAARAASRAGKRVVLVDEGQRLGGRFAGSAPADEAADLREMVEELIGADNARLLIRATVLGVYDAGYVVVAERRLDHLGADAPVGRARQRLWHFRAASVVLAGGSCERPIVFADNDRPGVMLAGAAREYLARYGVAAGSRACILTCDDAAYAAAGELHDAGVSVAAVVDTRREVSPALADGLSSRRIELLAGHAVVGTHGSRSLAAAIVARIDERAVPAPDERVIDCDLLGVSGGFVPSLGHFRAAGGALGWSPQHTAHLPHGGHPWLHVAGSAAGAAGYEQCRADGDAAGAFAAAGRPYQARRGSARESATPPVWMIAARAGPREDYSRHFVDLTRDATVADMRRAVGAGMRSPEHVKRYTTIGTGPEQGQTSGLVALGILAGLLNRPTEELPPTTSRPPAQRVCFGLLAGRDVGKLSDPMRVTSIHTRHLQAGAVFEDVGQWKRPWFYPRPGEDMDSAVARECEAVRTAVGMMDASTLGKIDVKGPDAGELLDRVYTNLMSSLAVGTCRYGLMCRADGMVFDDGVVMRLGDDHFVTSTTTGNAAVILDWLEEWIQTEWPELRVRLTSVTDHWAAVAVAGPASREAIAAAAPEVDVSKEAFPFMALREGQVAGIPARLMRVSFSGELAFEVHVPAWHGAALWDVIAASSAHGVTPYGTEAMHVLRAEKGFIIVGQDTDATVTPHDLQMGWAVSPKKDFFVGRRSHRRMDMLRDDRLQLVGLLPAGDTGRVAEGSALLDGGQLAGHVTSSYDSRALGHPFALGLLRAGSARRGEAVTVQQPDGRIGSLEVTAPVFYDPGGRRRDG